MPVLYSALVRTHIERDHFLIIGVRFPGPIAEIPIEEAKRAFDTNVFSAMRLASAIIPSMAKIQAGRIVNIGSVAGEM